MNTRFVVAPKEPVKDVFEASMAAAAIRANIPGLPKRFLRLFRQAVQMNLHKKSVSRK
jgi:hypothetical protein